ncbi:hypothetical protein HYH03_014643 [Edaphochlamys debaryana]|uniref:O-fucosyltransferase family protein n=1 Tax=Edaphochlamys debaryana TaxID=47281 RepID=A0A836BS00_9CHLO|nr:hypothetical protein HYH03_014643 [Edaphochlamys debaryana]|eukprot:KAG2486715.1 hypothetical protein HYH03_014643 [Edaphochlamys debaryana]
MAKPGDGFGPRTLLVPILWHGPNNQITSAKEVLALAKLLEGDGPGDNITLVLPDLNEHYSEHMRKVKMLFSELFDMNALRRGRVNHVLMHDLMASGWDGQLDAVVMLRDKSSFPPIDKMCRLMGVAAPREQQWLHSPLSHYLGCTQDRIDQLRDMIKPYRYVGILCFHDLIAGAQRLAGPLLIDCQDQCCQAYKDRSVLLRKSPLLHQLAGELMASTLGKHRRFIAAHIRPMMDECLGLWSQPQDQLDPVQLSLNCNNSYILDRLVPNLQALMRRYNTSTVFVLAHPNIRHRVSRMLQAGGIRPFYIDLGALNASFAGAGNGKRKAEGLGTAAREPAGRGGAHHGEPTGHSLAGPKPDGPRLHTPPSVSLLGVVEEAIAAAATAFVGTTESSMTGMIVQERLARGMSPDDMYFFGARDDCADLPCRLVTFDEPTAHHRAPGLSTETEAAGKPETEAINTRAEKVAKPETEAAVGLVARRGGDGGTEEAGLKREEQAAAEPLGQGQEEADGQGKETPGAGDYDASERGASDEKEVLALAKLLEGDGPGDNITLVLPDLNEHYSDNMAREVKMLFSELFDMNTLRRGRVNHVLLDDLKAGGWDGQLDAIVFLRADHEFPHVKGKCRLMGLEPPGPDRWMLSPLSHYLGCTQDRVDQLRDMIKPYRYVGVLCFHDLVPQAHKMAGALLTDCADQCCQAYKDRSVLLRKSPLLHQLAGELMASTLGKHRRFIAAHIRPMPDPCLRIWAEPQEELDPSAVGATCINNYLLYRLVPNLQALMRRYNTSTVFVLAHPNIRHRLTKMLEAGGIRPAYIDLGALNASFAGAGGGRRKAHGPSGTAGLKLEDRGSPTDAGDRLGGEAEVDRGAGIKSGRPKGAKAVLRELGDTARADEEAAGPTHGGPRLHTPPSVSLLAVVEEAIAAAAVAFVGSKESSMTGMIVQERLARGMSPDDM